MKIEVESFEGKTRIDVPLIIRSNRSIEIVTSFQAIRRPSKIPGRTVIPSLPFPSSSRRFSSMNPDAILSNRLDNNIEPVLPFC